MTRSLARARRPPVCREPPRLLLGSAVLPPTSGQPWSPLAAPEERPSDVYIISGAESRASQGSSEDGRFDTEQPRWKQSGVSTARPSADGGWAITSANAGE